MHYAYSSINFVRVCLDLLNFIHDILQIKWFQNDIPLYFYILLAQKWTQNRLRLVSITIFFTLQPGNCVPSLPLRKDKCVDFDVQK